MLTRRFRTREGRSPLGRRRDFYTARYRAADAARQEALQVVVRRVQRVVVNRAFDGHFCLRAFVLSEFLSLQLGDFGLERS